VKKGFNEPVFDSENTPDYGSFAQVAAKTAKKQKHDDDDGDDMIHGDKMSEARSTDSSDYSVDQFLRVDDGREATNDHPSIVKKGFNEPVFDSENTPDYSFAQVGAKTNKEHKHDDDDIGDGMIHGDKFREHFDSSDYSVEQFLRVDEGREATNDHPSIVKKGFNEPVWDSENTPDYGSFAQTGAKGK